MKKHSRRISIILMLVLILTSFGFTGAFADDNNANAVGGNTDQIESDIPEAAPVEEATPAEEPAAEESTQTEVTVPAESIDAQAPEAPSAQAPEAAADAEPEPEPAPAPADKFTVTWVIDKETKTTSEVASGERPAYPDGTPVVPGYTDENYKFLGWSDGTTTYKPEEELPEATEDITYTAKFASLNVEPAKPVLKKNKNNQAFASYKSVYIEWNTIKDKNGYAYDKSVKVRCKVSPSNKNLKAKFAEKKYHSEMTLDPFKTYTFYVKSVITTDDGKNISSDEVKIKGSPVKSIIYNVSIKASGTLQKHAGNGPKTYYVSAGTTVPTIRFQTGKYIFEYKGSIFYISQTRVGRATATYNKKGSWNYTNKEAEYYIKDRATVKNSAIKKGTKSSTKNLIFVNTFCQHVYYFQKKDGAWKVTDGWECGTGLASTPTPTGNYGDKAIHGKLRKKNSIPYWNLFNGNAALHATKPNDHRVGMIISNGCIRNPDEKAEKIYKKCKLKTRVLIN